MAKRYLLMVEDNQDDVYLTMRTLERNGFEIPMIVVRNSSEALSHIRCSEQLPVAMLVSYRLPGLSGVELIDCLRADERTSSTPAILLTASPDEREHVCGEECSTGANRCLVKPLAYSELAGALEELDLQLNARAVEPELPQGRATN